MIVYATRLDLVDADPRAAIRAALREWLGRKLHAPLPERALQPGSHSLGASRQIEIEEHEDSASWALSCRYSHPDRDVHGRTWHTEVGLARESDRTRCTILLHTAERSTLVDARPETTRPALVAAISKACRIRSSTPGGVPRPLTIDDEDAFREVVMNPDRSHAIVQISHRIDGEPVLDPRRVGDLLLGIADVVVIPPDVDTFALARKLGKEVVPYNGAINVLWPVVRRSGAPFVPNTRLLGDELLDSAARGLLPERELLARICHYASPRLSRDHVSMERVRSLRLHSVIAGAQAAAGPREDAEIAALVRQVDGEQRQEIEALRTRISCLERDLKATEEERDEARSKASALEVHLSAKVADAATPVVPEALRDCILRTIGEAPCLEDCLLILSHLFPGRVVILPSAWKSAREAAGFRRSDKAFELLRKLFADYFDAMSEGLGDRAGQQVFGPTSFAARESEGVENNKRARSLRTFVYEGEPIEMMRHIKIGVKDSVAETFRAHFHWDDEGRRIVLGHCGCHLDQG